LQKMFWAPSLRPVRTCRRFKAYIAKYTINCWLLFNYK